ncbi:MAG: hypothetical protein ABI461_23595, partial [Polyangiaceae bacterium]
MKSIRPLVTLSAVASCSIFVALAACSGAKHSSDFGNGDGDGGLGNEAGSFGSGEGGSGPCVNLQCQQTSCPSGGTTSISG